MKKNLLLLLSVFLFHSVVMHAQISCIAAGDITLSNYTDLSPDSFISSTPHGVCFLDIDHDGYVDFRIETFYQGGVSGSSTTISAYILATGENKVLVNAVNNNIPDTLKNTDSICLNNTWSSFAHFINYGISMGSPGSSYSHLEWSGQNKYVGLKLSHFTGTVPDSTFGWIEVSVSYSGSASVIIKGFGCGTIAPYSLTPPSSSPPLLVSPSETVLYPNPSNGIVNINLPDSVSSEIRVFDYTGAPVYHDYNQRLVDLGEMPAGIYMLYIEAGDRKIKEKIIKTNRAR